MNLFEKIIELIGITWMFLTMGFLGFLILIGVILGISMLFLIFIILVGATNYTITEWIPYNNLPDCLDLEIESDEYVWNSPRKIPEGIDVIKCDGSGKQSLLYEARGIPLFYLGRFSPPADFPIKSIEWGFFGGVKSVSDQYGTKFNLKDIDLEKVLAYEKEYHKTPPIGIAGMYSWSMP